jgi:hypothetical protein
MEVKEMEHAQPIGFIVPQSKKLEFLHDLDVLKSFEVTSNNEVAERLKAAVEPVTFISVNQVFSALRMDSAPSFPKKEKRIRRTFSSREEAAVERKAYQKVYQAYRRAGGTDTGMTFREYRTQKAQKVQKAS